MVCSFRLFKVFLYTNSLVQEIKVKLIAFFVGTICLNYSILIRNCLYVFIHIVFCFFMATFITAFVLLN